MSVSTGGSAGRGGLPLLSQTDSKHPLETQEDGGWESACRVPRTGAGAGSADGIKFRGRGLH